MRKRAPMNDQGSGSWTFKGRGHGRRWKGEQPNLWESGILGEPSVEEAEKTTGNRRIWKTPREVARYLKKKGEDDTQTMGGRGAFSDRASGKTTTSDAFKKMHMGHREASTRDAEGVERRRQKLLRMGTRGSKTRESERGDV